MKTVVDKDMLYIPEQFEKPSDFGYLRRHVELTGKLTALLEREDTNPNAGYLEGMQERRKDDLFHQACEDVARSILLNDDAITSISVADVQAQVEARYNQFLECPELAVASRSAAVH